MSIGFSVEKVSNICRCKSGAFASPVVSPLSFSDEFSRNTINKLQLDEVDSEDVVFTVQHKGFSDLIVLNNKTKPVELESFR